MKRQYAIGIIQFSFGRASESERLLSYPQGLACKNNLVLRHHEGAPERADNPARKVKIASGVILYNDASVRESGKRESSGFGSNNEPVRRRIHIFRDVEDYRVSAGIFKVVQDALPLRSSAVAEVPQKPNVS